MGATTTDSSGRACGFGGILGGLPTTALGTTARRGSTGPHFHHSADNGKVTSLARLYLKETSATHSREHILLSSLRFRHCLHKRFQESHLLSLLGLYRCIGSVETNLNSSAFLKIPLNRRNTAAHLGGPKTLLLRSSSNRFHMYHFLVSLQQTNDAEQKLSSHTDSPPLSDDLPIQPSKKKTEKSIKH